MRCSEQQPCFTRKINEKSDRGQSIRQEANLELLEQLAKVSTNANRVSSVSCLKVRETDHRIDLDRQSMKRHYPRRRKTKQANHIGYHPGVAEYCRC